MYASDWERLGISPTRELAAIKRAYAVQLKSNRPDDDAEAYQALRQAYERVQYWARSAADEDEAESAPTPAAASEPLPTSGAEPVPEVGEQVPEAASMTRPQVPAEVPSAAAEEAANADADTEAAPELTPEALVHSCYHLWQAQGDAALLDAWPRIEAALYQLPLAWQLETSARFADMVIGVNGLPHAFVQHLQRHFAWLGDFRIDRALGPARAEALRQALADIVVPPVTDPQLLHQLADVRLLHRLVQGRWRLQAWSYAALLGWPLQRHFLEAGPRLLRGLGMEIADQKKMADAFEVAKWCRIAVLAMLLLAACLLVTQGDEVRAFEGWLVAIVGSVMAMVAALLLGAKLSGCFNGRVAWSPGISRRLHLWRGSAFAPWMGLGALLLAMPFFWLAHRAGLDQPLWPWFVGACLTLVAVVSCWSARVDLGVVGAAAWGFLVACLLRVVPPEGVFWPVFAASGFVVLLAMLHADSRWTLPKGNWPYAVLLGGYSLLRLTAPLSWGQAALWLAVGAASLAGSLLVLRRVGRDGFRSTLAPMALASGVVVAAGEHASPAWLLFGWVIADLAVMALQHGAEWLGRRLLGRTGDVA